MTTTESSRYRIKSTAMIRQEDSIARMRHENDASGPRLKSLCHSSASDSERAGAYTRRRETHRMTGPTPHSAIAPLRRTFIGLVCALGLVASLLGSTIVGASESRCDERPLIVKIHASWCSTCKVLDSLWQQLDSDMGDRVMIVSLPDQIDGDDTTGGFNC